MSVLHGATAVGTVCAVPVYALGEQVPEIHATAVVHPDAVIIGSVTIGERSSIGARAVLRADDGEIRIGARSSIGEDCVLHTTTDDPTVVGDDCVLGARVHLEGCRIESASTVGAGAVLLHRVLVGPSAAVDADAVVIGDTVVPPGSVAAGVPARIHSSVSSD